MRIKYISVFADLLVIKNELNIEAY